MDWLRQRIGALLQRLSGKGKHMNAKNRKRREWFPILGNELKEGETVEQWKQVHEAIWRDGFISLLRNSRRLIIKQETDRYIQLSPTLAVMEVISNGTQESREHYRALYGLAARHMGAYFGPGLMTIRIYKPGYALFEPVIYHRV